MSSKRTLGNEVSVDEQADEQIAVDVAECEERPERRASVEQDVQAKVDYAGEQRVEGRLFGQTLEAEERLAAREWEIERTKARSDRHQTAEREARTRRAAGRVSEDRRREFGKRAASVDPWADPDGVDPREQLTGEELGTVNREASRLAGKLEGWSRAAISRRVAERVVLGADVQCAVLEVFEELQQAPGQVIPIAAVGEVSRPEVSIAGRVAVLWNSQSPAIQQVGLIEDESGRTKFTVWRKSAQPRVDEGERVVFRNVSKSWYQGRVSVALTGWSQVAFPERERWWDA